MHTTIIFAHPWHGSYNKALLDHFVQLLSQSGQKFTVIDLYKDGFDPVLDEKGLSVYHKGAYTDPAVARYMEILKKTDKLIFIFPIWWYDCPAILRGFFDKVLLEGFAFCYEDNRLLPMLDIRSSCVVTTSEVSTEDLIDVFGDPIQKTLIAGTFNAVGIRNARWFNIGGIKALSEEARQEHIKKAAQFALEK